MSKIKAAYGLAKAAGKAYKLGFKTSKASTLTKQARAYKSAGQASLKRAAAMQRTAMNGKGKTANMAMNAAYKNLYNAKKFGQTARVKAADARSFAKAGKKLDSMGGLTKVAAKAGAATRVIGGAARDFTAGYAVGKAIRRVVSGKKPQTFKQKAALKKAQLASALKRKK